MSANASERQRRQAFFDLPIRQLAGWRLMAVCPACCQECYLRPEALAARYGAENKVSAIVRRLRCSERACRMSPSLVKLFGPSDYERTGRRSTEVVLVGPAPRW